MAKTHRISELHRAARAKRRFCRYWITYNARLVTKECWLCLVPDERIALYDRVLAVKLALEAPEAWVLDSANVQLVFREPDTPKRAQQGWLLEYPNPSFGTVL